MLIDPSIRPLPRNVERSFNQHKRLVKDIRTCILPADFFAVCPLIVGVPTPTEDPVCRLLHTTELS